MKCVIVGILLFLVLALLLGGGLAIETPFRLAVGWLFFLQNNLEEMTFEWGRIAGGVAGMALATAGLHFLAIGWRRFSSPESPRWRWRWSAAITLMMVAMSVAALSVAGTAHQIAWLKGEPMLEYGFAVKQKSARNIQNIAYLLFDFAGNHENQFPKDLPELVAWAFGPKGNERDISSLLFFTGNHRDTPEPWLYFGRGKTDEVPNETILLASPRPRDGLRLVVTADGKVGDIPEEKFQKLFSSQMTKPPLIQP